MACADMAHLVFLPSGDAALTRRAKAGSRLSAVVVRFSGSRRRFERQGILVEEQALERAERECLADEDARSRRRERDAQRRIGEDLELQARMAAEIVRLFPGCPPERAQSIARHTSIRGSGRVGRGPPRGHPLRRALDVGGRARARTRSGAGRGRARVGRLAAMSGSSKTPIYGPEPWATTIRRRVSYWDLWFCVVALADHDGDLDELALAIEEGGRLSGGGTAEAKLSHLDDLRRRMAQAGIDAQTLVAVEDTDPKIRAKARAKVLKQGLYPRDMTEPMWHPPRERLYERALHGRWSLFPVSPKPFYERLCNGLGEGFARRARRSSSRAGWRPRSSASTAPRPTAPQRDSLPAVRWWRGATGRWSAAMTPTA